MNNKEKIFKKLSEMVDLTKGKLTQGISVKRFYDSKGDKTKWQDIKKLYFSYKETSFTCIEIKFYFDPETSFSKNPLESIEYFLIGAEDNEKTYQIVKSCLRVIRINKLLTM
jgi:hypothetical protein